MPLPTIYGWGMGPYTGDSQQVSLVKAVAFLTELLLLNGMPLPNLYGPCSGPYAGDSPQVSLVKIVALLKVFVDGGGGGGMPFAYWEDTGPTPSGPPPDQAQVWTVHFRDGFPSMTWDPSILAWR